MCDVIGFLDAWVFRSKNKGKEIQVNARRIVPLTALLLTFVILGFPSFSNGAIVETVASAGMEIGYQYDPVGAPSTTLVDVSQTVTNSTNAQVNFDGNLTTGHVTSIWHFNDLNTSAGHGNLYFDYAMIGDNGAEGKVHPTYLGQTEPGANYGMVTYLAESASEVRIAWNFTVHDLFTSTPLNMDLWQYNADGTYHIRRLDAWSDLAYTYGPTGEETYMIEEGYRYILKAWSFPNISGGGLQNFANRTAGNITFDFNTSSVPIPIPGAVWLLGSGLIGIVGVRRKLKS